MPKIEPKEKRLVAIVSGALGVVIVVATILTLILFRGVTLPFQWDQLLTLGLIISLFQPATVEYLDLRWQRGIDKNIPGLLR